MRKLLRMGTLLAAMAAAAVVVTTPAAADTGPAKCNVFPNG